MQEGKGLPGHCKVVARLLMRQLKTDRGAQKSIVYPCFPKDISLMTDKIQHFALFQSTLQNVSFVKLPRDKLGSKALNMFKYVAFF